MEDLGGIGTASIAVEQGMDTRIGFQRLIQSAVDQSSIVGIPDGEGVFWEKIHPSDGYTDEFSGDS